MDNKTGSGDKVLDWVVIIAAVITFFKTADVFSFYAPQSLNQIFGFDISYIYGAVNALLVEGAMLVLHFNRRAHKHPPAQIAKWILLAICLLCQIFDGFITTDTLAQQSDEMKFLFQYGVPGLPIVILLMIFGIGQLPDGEKVANVGLKNKLPNWNKIWNGDEVTTNEQDDGANNGNREKRQKGRENWQTISRSFTREDYLFIAGGTADEVSAQYGIPQRTAYNWQRKAKRWLSRNKR